MTAAPCPVGGQGPKWATNRQRVGQWAGSGNSPGAGEPGRRLAKGAGAGKDPSPRQVQLRLVSEARATAQGAALGGCWGLGFRTRLKLREGNSKDKST